MVYFGPRRNSSYRKGLSAREKMRVAGPILLLLALGLIVLYPGNDKKPPAVTPVDIGPSRPDLVTPPDAVSSDVGIGVPNVPDPVEITPLVEMPPLSVPFVENPLRLESVRDGAAVVAGESELDGQIYLFHRIRAAIPVEQSGEAPLVAEIGADPASLRGKRFQFVVTLIENPQPRVLRENDSGITRYWEVFGSDVSGSLHRIDFIDKPKNLPSGSDVLVDGDFLRLYRYRTVQGVEGMVPQWVAADLEIYQSPFQRRGSPFLAMWVVGTISLVTLLTLVIIQISGRTGRISSRTARKRRGSR